MGWLKTLFGGGGGGDEGVVGRSSGGLGVEELARRVGIELQDLRKVPVRYREFTIPKRNGGERRIYAPEEPLKAVQRRVLRGVLGRLRAHEAANGFEAGRSIVSNAARHVGKAVVVRMDVKEFFASTNKHRVIEYFKAIGWDDEAADLLVKLCTHKGGLPQGAPTSPRLSNLVNWRLDERLVRMAEAVAPGSVYTRYADDITFSLEADERAAVRSLIFWTRRIAKEEGGYQVHQRAKMRVIRRNDRQLVTGLVVNERVNLPRAKRRWLRAVRHHAKTGREATLTPEQLAGWDALESMVRGRETERGGT
jgi:hypothetical protein